MDRYTHVAEYMYVRIGLDRYLLWQEAQQFLASVKPSMGEHHAGNVEGTCLHHNSLFSRSVETKLRFYKDV